ncbi:MAG: hypothetical protein ACRCZD_11450 [Phycicoccus sp.]
MTTASTSSPVLRGARIAIPGLLACYAVTRWVDGRDGEHGRGPAWDIGHLAFLAAFVGVDLVVVALIRVAASLGGG